MENEKIIKLKKNNILKLEIETEEGIKTGEYLEFDLEDIELPLKYAELIEEDKKNKKWLRDEQLIIDKRQDVQVKGELMSKNTIDKFKALETFFKKEVEIYNGFLGKNGVQKLLNGQKVGWTTLEMVDEIIEEQIVPYLDLTLKNITEKVKEKYGKAVERQQRVLEVDE